MKSEVPEAELPRGVSYKAIYGEKKEKTPENTVRIQKILTFLEGTKGNRA